MSQETTQNDIDAMIEEEQRLVAFENHNQAWAGTLLDGIDTRISADAAISTALKEIIQLGGETEALSLLEELKTRVLSGDLSPEHSVH